MESISIFDMLKVGVGPSSSHTLGPWRAAQRWVEKLKTKKKFEEVQKINIDLYGSLSLTGKGHATDIATMLGLSGYDPVTIPIEKIDEEISRIRADKTLFLDGEKEIPFDDKAEVIFNEKFLKFHSNGMKLTAFLADGKKVSDEYYSIGGGFVVQKERKNAKKKENLFHQFPHPVQTGEELLAHCRKHSKKISEIVWENEQSLRSDDEINKGIKEIWDVMLESMYIGCHTEGTLPGGLNVRRRAYGKHKALIGDATYANPEEWIAAIRNTEVKFRSILRWVSCFALAVNEVNAALGRVVTAPTNGAAGVIPAVLMYYQVIENHQANFDQIKQFLLTASEIGSLFKKNATISAAMGGCQAEIGVSSSMAAGALTELSGGTPEQVLMAAEIAMEHHLGLTCDPIKGLVQIPCIERNTMGAIKAINAAELALNGDVTAARVTFDEVVETMWETAQDMSTRYKETSRGGLAVKVNLSDC